jgi:hypothetical protein
MYPRNSDENEISGANVYIAFTCLTYCNGALVILERSEKKRIVKFRTGNKAAD